MVKKLPRWQKEQKVRHRRKTRYTIWSTLLVIFLLIVGGFGWKIYASVAKSVWDGENQINLVLNSSPVLVASFNPPEKSINVLIIPNGTFIEVIHGFGPYRVESIYGLGELNGSALQNGRGGELLSGSIQEYLGMPVDAYISVQSAKCKVQSRESKTCLLDQLFWAIRRNGRTDLTKWDLIRLWWGTRGVREDKIKVVNLGETSASEEVTLPDGTKAAKIDTEQLQGIVGQLFIDGKIKQNDLTIAVLNGTDHQGLATRASRLVENIGGRVVGIGEVESSKLKVKSSKCEVRSGKKYKNTYTVQKLLKVFDCQWTGEDLENQRAEVVLILGERYWQKLNHPIL